MANKVRCNMCYNIYNDEIGYEHESGVLVLLEDEGELIRACPICKTGGYLMDVDDKESFNDLKKQLSNAFKVKM